MSCPLRWPGLSTGRFDERFRRAWEYYLAYCEAGFRIVPIEADRADHAVIEVYPAIAKRGNKKSDRAVASVERHIPDHLTPGTDPYDAAVCAILAAVHAGQGKVLGLPDLEGPQPGYDPAEGWIYGLPADHVRAQSGVEVA